MDAPVRLWTCLVLAGLPVLAAATVPGETDVGFSWGRGRHYNICGAPSTFGAFSGYAETRVGPGIRAGVAGQVIVEDPASDMNVAYSATVYAGYDWRWFGFTAGGGITSRVGLDPTFLPQLSLRGGGETGLRGEAAIGLPTGAYPAFGLFRTGAAWGGDLYEIGLGVELLPWQTPGGYGYAGLRIEELVLRINGHIGPIIPGSGSGQGVESGLFGTVGLHFDHPTRYTPAPPPDTRPSAPDTLPWDGP